MQYKQRNGRRGERTGETRRNDQAHEPLVARELWEFVQSATKLQRDGTYVAGVAGGLLRCSGCGGVLNVSGSRTKQVYQCRRFHGGKRCEGAVAISKRRADQAVEELVLDKLTERIGTVPGSRLPELRAAEAGAEAELTAYVEATSELGHVAALRHGVEIRTATLDAARRAREQEEARIGAATTLPEPDAYRQLPAEDRRRVARNLIAEIQVGPALWQGRVKPLDRLTVRYR